MKDKIIFVCGPMCSGKDYYINNTVKPKHQDYNIRIIKIGDVVRHITKLENRIFKNDLCSDIILNVMHFLSIKDKQNEKPNLFIIDGARQKEIIETVINLNDLKIEGFEDNQTKEIEIVWLEVNKQKRIEYCKTRSDKKDIDSNIESLVSKDDDFCKEIKQYIINNVDIQNEYCKFNFLIF